MHLLPQRRFNGGRMKQNQRISCARMRTLQLDKEAIVFDRCSVADGRRRVQPDSPQFPARLQALEEIDDGGRGEGLQRRAAQEQSAREHPQRQRCRRKQRNGIPQQRARNAEDAQHFQRDERPPGEEAVPVQRVRRRPAQHDAPRQRREQQHEPGERCAR